MVFATENILPMSWYATNKTTDMCENEYDVCTTKRYFNDLKCEMVKSEEMRRWFSKIGVWCSEVGAKAPIIVSTVDEFNEVFDEK